ncbi:hypothetical protein [Methanocaldococcus sp.]
MINIFKEAFKNIKKEELFILIVISLAIFFTLEFKKYLFTLFFVIILNGFYLKILKEDNNFGLVSLLIDGIRYMIWFLLIFLPIYILFCLAPSIILLQLGFSLYKVVVITFIISFIPMLFLFLYIPIGEVDFAKYGFSSFLRIRNLIKNIISVKYLIFITILYLVYSIPVIFIFVKFLFILSNILAFYYGKKAETLYYKKYIK